MTAVQIICVLYLRLSDGRNEAGNGTFADREAKLRARAAQLGWIVSRVVVENDMQNGSKNASAFKRRRIGTDANGDPILRVWRPGFREVLADLAAGRVHAVLAEDLDRAMRDPRDLEDLIDVVERNKCGADSLSGSLRFTMGGGTDAEITTARLMVTIANKSSRDTARRVGEARQRQAGNGQWGGGRRPYGFTPVAHPSGNHRNTELEVCEPEAEEIRHAAAALLSGTALKAIARDMIGRGVETVTGTRWTAETLRDVLLRPINAGIIVHRGQPTDVRLEGDPILAQDTWRAVESLLKNPDRATGPGRAPCWLGTNIYRCVCGAPMAIARGRNRAATYRCDPDQRPADAGDVHVRRNAEQLDSFVSDVLVKRLMRPSAADLVTPARPDVDVAALRAEADAIRERSAQMGRDYQDELIDRSTLLAGTKRGRARLDAIDEQLAAAVVDSPLARIVNAADVRAMWNDMPLYDKRAVLDATMRVTVLPATRRGRGFDPDAVRIERKTP